MTEQWMIQFDSRSDGGPHDVGPFPTRRDAEAWTDTLRGPEWSASFCIVPMTPPNRAGRVSGSGQSGDTQ